MLSDAFLLPFTRLSRVVRLILREARRLESSLVLRLDLDVQKRDRRGAAMSTLICRSAPSPSQTTDSTMSSYFLGPFGRMLPAINSRSPEKESRPSPNLSASASESHLYRLPPPRAPVPLQFGSDPFLRQSTPAEKIEFERGRPWSDMATTKSEQLPPVSQLLTPVSRSSAATSPYHPQPFANPPAPSHEPQGPYHFPRHGPIVPTNALPASVQENPLQQQQPRSLPPISEIPVRRPDNGMWSHQGTHWSPPASPSQNGRFGNSTATMPPYRRPDVEPRPPGAAVSPADSQPPAPPVRPHVIDERYIEGEGLCYIYADGTYCPKTINGVPVNANWGITKAGRPRKRLAQACLTCREKKIKCYPNLPKCEQCQKSGRVCRFENA